MNPPFANSDFRLRQAVADTLAKRKAMGLDGLIGGLDHIVVNVEENALEAAVAEFLALTGYALGEAFEDDDRKVCVLTLAGSADILVSCRKRGDNPFAAVNAGPKTASLPNTRLETYVFTAPDLPRQAYTQRSQGVSFQSPVVLDRPAFRCIQTTPSAFTGNSIGYIQWKPGCERSHATAPAKPLKINLAKPEKPYLAHVGRLDHTATRVRAEHRDPAILEFLSLTNYTFSFAVHVPELNSITNVARHPGHPYAQVFTSGVSPFSDLEHSGPTEKFIHNYGTRTHHLAFETSDIAATVTALGEDGLGFLSPLAGSQAQGIHQIFSNPSPATLLVNEYIERYHGFDGFFTQQNVTILTQATDNQ